MTYLLYVGSQFTSSSTYIITKYVPTIFVLKHIIQVHR